MNSISLEKMQLPNLIIVGPPKTGTTSIFNWLNAHPECFGTQQKETHFFADHINSYNQSCNYIEHGMSAYNRLFSEVENERIIMEATAGYIDSTNAFEAIPSLDSNPLLFFIYRNPVERIWSEYVFMKYKTKDFKGDLMEYLGYDGNRFSGKNFERGKIVSLINKWIEKVGRDRVYVFDFSDLKRPLYLMRMMCGILKIESGFYDSFSFEKLNESYRVRNRAFHLSAMSIKKIIPKKMTQFASEIYFKLNGSSLPEITAKEKHILSELGKHYADQDARNLLTPIVTLDN
ncbi:sulfotransferase domain-containing protein [Ekhidna sp.]|uniref:sulfotransferase domain-containing protein n=1 Tax=Ekhidna sp. TaxID=2608089 RepID=UPI0035182C8A